MTTPTSLWRFVRGRAALVLAVTLLPAGFCTLLTWWLSPDWWQLSVFFWYSIPANSFLWLPHEPGVIVAGTLFAPALVAATGGVATMVASIVDHAVFTRTLRIEGVSKVKQTRIMRFCINLFNKQPFGTIVIFAFTPIPFYPIRLVAPMSNYPMARYVSAVVIGRVPRYFLLAMGGAWISHRGWLPLPF